MCHRQTRNFLVSFLLCKGPVDVTLWILVTVEDLGIRLIEREVLFQPVRQIRLQIPIVRKSQATSADGTNISQKKPSVTNQSTRPIRKLHTFLTIVSAIAHEDLGSPDVAKELVRFLSVAWTFDFYRIEEGKVRVECLYPLSEIGECRFGIVHPHP